LNEGADILLAAEAPEGNWEARLGKAPPIYSREINYWLFAAALDILSNLPEIGLIYIHTTDYPMHMWPPEAAESKSISAGSTGCSPSWRPLHLKLPFFSPPIMA
jgi:phosphonoacetate hydrolase